MKKTLFLLTLLTALGAAGCSSSDNADKPGYSKEDFAKTPPPPGYGPPQGGAPATPPANGK